MPIKRENAKRYPPNWREVSLAVREAAGWRCEFCGAAHGIPHPVTGAVVVLTVMHLDHQPEHNERANLRAACQRCHNQYDAPHRRRNASATLAAKRGAGCGRLAMDEDRTGPEALRVADGGRTL